MADDSYPTASVQNEGSEEALREQDEVQSSKQAQEDSEAAERLKAEEFSQRPPEQVTGEAPFGGRKDDTALIDDSGGTPPLLEEEDASYETGPETLTPDARPAAAPSAPVHDPDVAAPESLQPQPGVGRVASQTPPSGSRLVDVVEPVVYEGATEAQGDSGAAILQPQEEPVEVAAAAPEQLVINAQPPSLTVEMATGDEDSQISLNIEAGLQDSDGGSESLSIRISNVPDGVTLSAGTNLGGGVWELAPGDLSGLTLTLPPDSNVDFDLTVTATSTEANGDSASVSSTLSVDVVGVADVPELTASLGSGAEDGPVALDITGSLTDTDGSETLTFVVSSMPEGASLSAGVDNGDGTWTVTPADLAGLQFNPPANYSGDIDLNVSAVATENDGDTATVSTSVSGTFTPVVDTPTMTAEDATGLEDSAIDLTVSASLVDTSETLSVTVSGVPADGSLNHGTDNGNGTWSVNPVDLADLSITPPHDYSGNIALTFTGTSTESDGSTATQTASLNVHVTGVADAPILTAGAVAGAEDTAVALGIRSALSDTDGSETLTLTVDGVPDGFTLSAGHDNGNGTWTLTPGDLTGLTISSPHDYSGSFSLNVTAETVEADGDSASVVTVLPVTFNAVADNPILTVDPASTLEDTAVELDISTAITDDSETITGIVISGMPAGATLSAGVDNGNGSWTLDPADLAGLTLNPAANSNEDFTLTVTSTSREPNGSTAQTTAHLPVSITGVADDPNLSTQDAAGNEDTWIGVDVAGTLNDTDSSETLHFEISGIPEGARLNVGTEQADGTWTVAADDIGGLKVRPPHNYSGSFEVGVKAVASENDGDTASVSSTLVVDVDARADKAGIGVRSVVTEEDNDLSLSLNTWVRDDSENIQSTTITGVPAGFTVLGGTDLGNGKWSVSPDNLDDISLRPPEDYSGSVRLGFTVVTVEPENGSTATTSRGFNATFTADADAPTVTGNDVITNEDTPVQLGFGAALTDLDGSESLAVMISGVPGGASLSAGTYRGNGTWSVDPADLATLELRPPHDFSGDISLTMTATSTEASNADTATTQMDFNVHVVGVADEPSLATMDVFGSEDTAIPLTIRAETTDTDGSETVYVEFSNVPDGATFSAGFVAANGNWQVAATDLSTLTITPPDDSNEDFTMTVRSLTVEADGDENYSDPQTIDVGLRGVADAPDVTVGTARGDEDTAIPLNFHAVSTDADGSETISYIITGVPDGASLSSGIYIGNGRWSVEDGDMPSLTITPPTDFGGTFNLGVTVVAQEDDGHQTSQTYRLPVTVDAVVDDPARGGIDGESSYGGAGGTEDTAIALNVDPGPGDSDGSEQTLWVEVSDVPDGAVLAVNGVALHSDDGVYRIEPADFSRVTITPPNDSDTNFDLHVRAAIQDGDATAFAEGPLHVHVRGDADMPTLEAGDISGTAGEPVAVDISSALTDTDGSESLNFIISGLEGTGVMPSHGINLGGGSFLVSAAQLENLTFSSGDSDVPLSTEVTVHAVATETGNGDQATNTATFTIDLAANSDGGDGGSGGDGGDGGDTPAVAPTVTVVAPTGAEDQAFSVDVAAEFSTSGTQTGIILSDLPAGASPNIGFYNPIDNTWIIAGDDPALGTLAISPPTDYAGALDFTVSVAQTNASGSTQTESTTVTATLSPVVDGPSVSLGNARGTEDTPLDINLDVHATDADGSESIAAVVITGLPAGASLLGATDLGGGRFAVDPDQVDQLQFVPPANEHGNFSFTVETVVQESDGSQATFSRTMGVNIAPEVDAATLSTDSASGFEDSPVALTLDADLFDSDGSEVMAITISNVPIDALFSAGSNNGDGTWTFTPAQLNGLTFTAPPDANGSYNMTLNAHTLEMSTGQTVTTSQGFTVEVAGVADQVPVDAQDSLGDEDTAIPIVLDYAQVDTDGSESVTAVLTGIPEGSQLSAGILQANGSWAVPGDSLDTLTITPPQHFSGEINIHAEVVVSEADGDTASTGIDLTVSVTGVADAPILTAQDAAGDEDTAIALDIDSTLVDSSEVLSVTIDGVPAGATLSAGTDNGNGSWTLEPGDLAGLTVTPAAHMSGEFTLDITATSTDGSSQAVSTASLDVTVTGVADAPILTAQDAAGDEDTAIALDIDSTLVDSSEVLSVTIDGVPAGATLSAGTDNGNGSWTLEPGDLAGLTVTPAAHMSGEFTLDITATSTDGSSQAVSTASLDVTVTGVADAPILTAQDAVGDEDTAIALDIDSTLVDSSEVLSVTIDGVPAGATLSAGTDNGNGSWTLEPGDLAGLTVTPAAHMSGEFTLDITATSTDGSSQAVSTASLDVTVTGVADAPILTAQDAAGDEDTAIALDIDSTLVDSSEVLSVTIDGVPAGATLSAGTDNGNGSWTLEPGDLAGLTVTPAAHMSGEFTLDITATSTDGSSQAVSTASLDVTVTGVADAPILTAQDAAGDEDTAIALDIDSTLVDSSEVLSVTIDGVPAGATLSAGTDNGNGSWTLEPDDLAGLTVTPAADDAGDFDLRISATSTDGGSQATTTETVSVSVEGQPDVPIFTTEDAAGTQDQPVDIDIEAQTTAPGESLSVTISGVPEGASLSAGTDNQDGSWTLDPADTEGLQITPPSGFSGDFDLDVTVDVMQDGNTLSMTESMGVSVEAVGIAGAGVYMSMLAASPPAAQALSGVSPQAQGYMDTLGFVEQPAALEGAELAQSLDQTLNPLGGGVDGFDLALQQPDDDQLLGDQALPDPTADPVAEDLDQGMGMDFIEPNQDG